MEFPKIRDGTHAVEKYIKLINLGNVISTVKVNTIESNSKEIQNILEKNSMDTFLPFYISYFKIKDLMHKSEELDPTKLKGYCWKKSVLGGILEECTQSINSYVQPMTPDGWEQRVQVYTRDLASPELTDIVNDKNVTVLKFYKESEVLYGRVKHKSEPFEVSEIYLGKTIEPQELKNRIKQNNFKDYKYKSKIKTMLNEFYANPSEHRIIKNKSGYDLIDKNSFVLGDFKDI
jgi:hypothetical protein